MAFSTNSELTATHAFTRLFIGLAAILFSSCAAIKNFPKNVPFVYGNKINLKAEGLSGEDRQIIIEKLNLYIDDSLQSHSRQILGFTQRVNPPVFDSVNVYRSITFMKSYLQSIGYYETRFDTFTVKTDTLRREQQLRTTTTFNIRLGKNLRIDTTVYSFKQPYLQHLADSSKSATLLKQGRPYSKEAVNQELERLSNIFRNHGFLKMNKAALRAMVDTTDPSLVSTDFLDIGEQLILAQKRRENPRISIEIQPQPGADSSIFLQYFVEGVFIYPEVKVTDEIDSLIGNPALDTLRIANNVLLRFRNNRFSSRLIARNTFLVPGTLYNEADYFKTINNLWKLGPWQQVEVKTLTRLDSLPQVNFHLFLTPAKKQYLQFDLEGSQNNNLSAGNVLSGRFAAAALNITHRNRNFRGQGIQSATIGRVGVELNVGRKSTGKTVQSFIASLNQSFSIPKMYWPFGFLEKRSLDAYRTQINLNASFTDRFELFKQSSFSAGPQWELRKGKHTHTWTLPNFEAVKIVTEPKLDAELVKNPALNFAFTPGNILSARYAYERGLFYARHPDQNGYFRLASEFTMPGDYRLFGQKFFKFVRLEGQLVHNINKYRHSWNFRSFGAVGWDLSGVKAATLPFFRQYVTGGSNSMRAWGLRQLGLGNSIASDTATFADRFGDIQLELNSEYRFRMFRFLGYNIDGVAFADIGNIWNHTPAADGNGQFALKNLYRDLAVGIGTGIRWDISYVVIRFDVGFKVKNPVLAGNGWIRDFEWKSSNRVGLNERSNLGLQFGIGYPF